MYPDLNQFTGAHGVVQVEPKTMAVLVCLYERAGEVVSVDNIVTEVWGSRPMGDNPVYKAMAKLRQALGEDSKSPKHIVTVPRMGYRLIVDVADGSRQKFDTTSANHGLLGRLLPIGLALIVGAALAAVFFWRPAVETVRFQSVSTFPGSHSQPSFAPDGMSFAFVSEADGKPHVWILEDGVDVPRQLTHGVFTDSRPRISPDGASVLFVRNDSLWSVPTRGGEPVEIVRGGYNPNWSKDGRMIVFERAYQVWTAEPNGARQERVTGIPRRELALAPRWPALSPDGTQLVYLDAQNTPLADLFVTALAGGQPRQLTFTSALASAPVWSHDGRHVIYSTAHGGSRTLWRVNVASGAMQALLTSSGDDDFPDLTPDGKSLIFSNSRERFTLLASNPYTNSHTTLHESRLILAGPELSPDGKTLTFFGAARTGGYQIFLMPVQGGALRMITNNPAHTHALPRWAPDSASLYFYLTTPAPSFGTVNKTGGLVTTTVEGWDWNSANGAQIQPGANAIIYSRLSGKAPVQTLIRDLASGEDRTFHATLEYPRWSQDGSHVIGSQIINGSFPGNVVVCPVEGDSCRTIANDARIPVYSRDESQIFFVRGFGLAQTLFVAAADGSGEERELMKMAPLFPLGPFYSVSDDGDILWIRHQVEPGEIWVTELPRAP